MFKESFQKTQQQTILMFPGNKIFIIGEAPSSGTQDAELRSISDSNSSSTSHLSSDEGEQQTEQDLSLCDSLQIGNWQQIEPQDLIKTNFVREMPNVWGKVV